MAHALNLLWPAGTSMTSRPGHVFPSFTIEAKGLQAAHYSALQNKLHSAHIVRTMGDIEE